MESEMIVWHLLLEETSSVINKHLLNSNFLFAILTVGFIYHVTMTLGEHPLSYDYCKYSNLIGQLR